MPAETESKEKAEAKTNDNDEKKKPAEEEDANVSKGEDDAEKAHDPYYPPVITLPEVSNRLVFSLLALTPNWKWTIF